MKLYIRQKVFSWGAKFSVLDEAGQERYHVQGEVFSLGHKLHVYDLSGQEVAGIEQKLMTFMPEYILYREGRQAAVIRKKFSWLQPKYVIEGPEWVVEGHGWLHDYRITCGGIPIVTISKEWMTWGDSYELDIADPRDEILALAVVLTIDCVLASSN